MSVASPISNTRISFKFSVNKTQKYSHLTVEYHNVNACTYQMKRISF